MRSCLHPSRSNDRPAPHSPAGRSFSARRRPARRAGSRVSGWPRAASRPRSRARPKRSAPSWRPRCATATSCSSAASSARARRRSCAAPRARSASSDPVTSPTFSIGHRYRGARRDRLAPRPLPARGPRRRGPGLLADYLGAGRIAFVEWPEDGERRAARRAPARDAQPTSAATARRDRGAASAERRDDRARLRHRHAARPRSALRLADGAHAAKRATTPPRARTRATPRGCWRSPTSCSRGPGSAGRDVERIAVGVGPGTFTGPARRRRHRPRARPVARRSSSSASRSLRALAPAPRAARGAGARRVLGRDRRAPRRGVRGRLRRVGEEPPRELAPPARSRREALGGAARGAQRRVAGTPAWLAVGDGARALPRRSSRRPASRCPPDDSPLHRVSGERDLRARRCAPSRRRRPARCCPTTGAGPTPSSRCEGARRVSAR